MICLVGTYAPLTKEGSIIVDNVLASCYGAYDNDLAHLAMTPMRMFPEIFNWIFNEDNGTPHFVTTAEEKDTFNWTFKIINTKLFHALLLLTYLFSIMCPVLQKLLKLNKKK